MTRPSFNLFFRKISSFLGVGAVVTSITLSSNFVLLKYLKTPLFATYIAVYALAILLSFLLNSIFTFKSEIKFSNLMRYYGIYITGLILGVIVMKFFTTYTNFENWIYPFMVLPFTTVWNFTTANKYLERPGIPE